MEVTEALRQLDLLQKKLYALKTADSALYQDGMTVAPRGTSEGRGVALAILAGERQKLMTGRETGELLEFLTSRKEELSFEQRRQTEELFRAYRQIMSIPADEYMEYTWLTNEAVCG